MTRAVTVRLLTSVGLGLGVGVVVGLVGAGCFGSSASAPGPAPGERLARRGDEIVACGQLFHTGTPVVLWTDPGGYDAYRVERRFTPWDKASWEATTRESKQPEQPNRYNLRFQPSSRPTTGPAPLTDGQLELVRGGGWPLELLQEKVDQFVLHYDVCGTSRTCFKVLHDGRGLSVHFLLDLDGTIYQTLDLKERAWHATTSNSRSIGIEIANMGAYANPAVSPLKEWYNTDETGHTRIYIPSRFGDGGIRTPNFVGRPARDGIVWGQVHGKRYGMYDFTPQQYEALTRLTAALCTVFPKIKCDYPRDAQGQLVMGQLPEDVLYNYQGVLGHFHVQKDKQDPGPAFQWDKVIGGARAMMKK